MENEWKPPHSCCMTFQISFMTVAYSPTTKRIHISATTNVGLLGYALPRVIQTTTKLAKCMIRNYKTSNCLNRTSRVCEVPSTDETVRPQVIKQYGLSSEQCELKAYNRTKKNPYSWQNTLEVRTTENKFVQWKVVWLRELLGNQTAGVVKKQEASSVTYHAFCRRSAQETHIARTYELCVSNSWGNLPFKIRPLLKSPRRKVTSTVWKLARFWKQIEANK